MSIAKDVKRLCESVGRDVWVEWRRVSAIQERRPARG